MEGQRFRAITEPAADLILFVVTVDFFDDTSIRHPPNVTDDLGKINQLLVVVNKAGTIGAAGGIRQAAAGANVRQLFQNY